MRWGTVGSEVGRIHVMEAGCPQHAQGGLDANVVRGHMQGGWDSHEVGRTVGSKV